MPQNKYLKNIAVLTHNKDNYLTGVVFFEAPSPQVIQGLKAMRVTNIKYTETFENHDIQCPECGGTAFLEEAYDDTHENGIHIQRKFNLYACDVCGYNEEIEE